MAGKSSKSQGDVAKAADTPPTPKFRRRADARPDEVLDAALALFIEKGFAATRVDEIAKRAGLSKGTVYLYFASKKDVLKGIVRRAVTPVADQTIAMMAGFEGSPRDAITMAMSGLAMRFDDPSVMAIPKLIIREAVVSPEIAQLYRKEVLNAALPMLKTIISKGIASGYFRAVDPELTVRSIMGPILIHVLLDEVFGITPEGGMRMDRLIENHLDIFFDGLSVKPGGVG